MSRIVARVLANCPYHIEASFKGFKHEKGEVMDPKYQLVSINGTEVPVGAGRAPIAQSSKPTPPTGCDVPVDFRVRLSGLPSWRAGRYNSVLVVTVMAKP